MKKFFSTSFWMGVTGLVISLFALNEGKERLMTFVLLNGEPIYNSGVVLSIIRLMELIGWLIVYLFFGGVALLPVFPKCKDRYELLPLFYIVVTVSLEYIFLWR